eukprot:COSAG05_NODE_310_length_11636_cov_115.006934_5_plen_80_part_00
MCYEITWLLPKQRSFHRFHARRGRRYPVTLQVLRLPRAPDQLPCCGYGTPCISAKSRILAPLDHRCCNVRPLSSMYGHP